MLVAEGELREGGPDAAPSAGEDAGACGFGGGVETEQDGLEEVVGEAADAVVRRRPAVLAAVTVAFRGHGDRSQFPAVGKFSWFVASMRSAHDSYLTLLPAAPVDGSVTDY